VKVEKMDIPEETETKLKNRKSRMYEMVKNIPKLLKPTLNKGKTVKLKRQAGVSFWNSLNDSLDLILSTIGSYYNFPSREKT
jgi:hypothetical protein